MKWFSLRVRPGIPNQMELNLGGLIQLKASNLFRSYCHHVLKKTLLDMVGDK